MKPPYLCISTFFPTLVYLSANYFFIFIHIYLFFVHTENNFSSSFLANALSLQKKINNKKKTCLIKKNEKLNFLLLLEKIFFLL